MVDPASTVQLDEAFERIEETILPCIAMMLETLIDVSGTLEDTSAKALAAEIETICHELESLTQAVERSNLTPPAEERLRIVAA